MVLVSLSPSLLRVAIADHGRRRERPGYCSPKLCDERKDVHDHEEQWQPAVHSAKRSHLVEIGPGPELVSANFWAPVSSSSGGDIYSSGGSGSCGTSRSSNHPVGVRSTFSSSRRRHYRYRQLKKRVEQLEKKLAEFVQSRETRPSRCTKSVKPQRSPSVQIVPSVETSVSLPSSQERLPSRFISEGVSGSHKPRGACVATTVSSASGVDHSVVDRIAEIWSSSDYVRGMSIVWGSTIWCCIATKIPSSPYQGGVPIGKPLLRLVLTIAACAAAFAYLTRSKPVDDEWAVVEDF
jgi:hypothetical protein